MMCGWRGGSGAGGCMRSSVHQVVQCVRPMPSDVCRRPLIPVSSFVVVAVVVVVVDISLLICVAHFHCLFPLLVPIACSHCLFPLLVSIARLRPQVRHIRLELLTAWGGEIVQYVGLSEIRFLGSAPWSQPPRIVGSGHPGRFPPSSGYAGAGHHGRIVTVPKHSAVKFSDVTLVHGVTDGTGGLVNNGTLLLFNVTLESNTSYMWDGGSWRSGGVAVYNRGEVSCDIALARPCGVPEPLALFTILHNTQRLVRFFYGRHRHVTCAPLPPGTPLPRCSWTSAS
jgi:hypothetical protein